jgi:hypothetical protein
VLKDTAVETTTQPETDKRAARLRSGARFVIVSDLMYIKYFRCHFSLAHSNFDRHKCTSYMSRNDAMVKSSQTACSAMLALLRDPKSRSCVQPGEKL